MEEKTSGNIAVYIILKVGSAPPKVGIVRKVRKVGLGCMRMAEEDLLHVFWQIILLILHYRLSFVPKVFLSWRSNCAEVRD